MKKFLAGVLALSLVLSMSACGGSGSGGEGDGASGSGGGVVDRVGKMLTAQGREYDKLITGSVGETLTNTFFSFTINDVKAADELDGYTPQTEGNKFIIADVTVKNVADDSIPVGNFDFTILWNTEEELSETDKMAYEVFTDGMYPDEVDLEKDGTLSGTLVFEIPADVNEFGIVYDELYDDEFKGNSYVVECKL